MKYQDSSAQSAEYLRQAIPLMSKQAAAMHPISYAVWYEYVSGHNKLLTSAVDEHTHDGRLLDEALTWEMYTRFIAEIDEATARRVASGFQRILADISQSASSAGDEAQRFGSVLEQWTDAQGPEAEVDAELARLLSGSREMQSAIGALKSRLDASHSEIENLRQEVSRAREDALSDALTGLANRRAFDQALADCLLHLNPGDSGPCLVMADIDHFKLVNDTYGHLFGDKIIRAVAQTLKQNIKGRDTAARFGGEEFVILLPDTPINGAQILAEKIRGTIEAARVRRADNHQEMTHITISLGVASHLPGESAGAFIERVDQALYASKHGGRNRVSLAA